MDLLKNLKNHRGSITFYSSAYLYLVKKKQNENYILERKWNTGNSQKGLF